MLLEEAHLFQIRYINMRIVIDTKDWTFSGVLHTWYFAIVSLFLIVGSYWFALLNASIWLIWYTFDTIIQKRINNYQIDINKLTQSANILFKAD